MIDPPEIILPDGITTTSLISQSEMTQFVTNTLNTWASTIATGSSGYDLDSFIMPDIKDMVAVEYTSGKNNHYYDRPNYNHTVVFDNFKIINKYLFGYYQNDIQDGQYYLASKLKIKKLDGTPLDYDSAENYKNVVPIITEYDSPTQLYGCFVDEEIEQDLSNFDDIVDYEHIIPSSDQFNINALLTGAYVYTNSNDERDHSKMLRMIFFTWDADNLSYYSVVGKRYLVIFLKYTDSTGVIPLFQMCSNSAFIPSSTPSGISGYRINIGLLYPRYYNYIEPV